MVLECGGKGEPAMRPTTEGANASAIQTHHDSSETTANETVVTDGLAMAAVFISQPSWRKSSSEEKELESPITLPLEG